MSQYPNNPPGSTGPHGFPWGVPENQSTRGLFGSFTNMFCPGQNTAHHPMDLSQLHGAQQQSMMLEGVGNIYGEVTNMRGEINDLKEAVNRCERKHTVSEENELLRQENHDLQNECEKLRQANQQLQHKIGEYVEIFTSSPGNHVMDQEVISRFKDLRSAVYAAVTEVWTPKLKEMIPPTEVAHESILECLGAKGPLNMTRSQHYICRIIFEMLMKYIFSRSVFGYFDYAGDAASHLRIAEHKFNEIVPMDRRNDVVQWRIATMKCSGYFKAEGQTPAGEAEKNILRKFGPITYDDRKAESLAKKRIHQICRDALELKLLMRKAEDAFAVYDFLGYSSTRVADFVSKFGDEPDNTGGPSGKVAFCRFGALLKYPSGESDGHPTVLEKAHVVVYA